MAITKLESPYSGGGSSSTIKQLGGSAADRPTPYSGGAAPADAGSGATPGTFDVNPLAPGDSLSAGFTEGTDWLSGMRNAIFGTSAPDSEGKHGGLLGDTPLVGPAARALTESAANVGGAVGAAGGAALAGVGGALEHVDLGSDEQHQELQRQFDAVPDSPEKRAALEQIAKDPGATGHYMAQVVKQAQQDLVDKGDVNPTFTTGAFHTPGSAAEAVDNILGLVGLTARAAERTWTGIATPGQEGRDRLATIMAVGDGQIAFNEDKGVLSTGLLAGNPTSGLNDVEAIAYKKVKDGDWTQDEARDFLVAHNQGFSHATIANVAGNAALDPQNLVGLGAFGVARLGATGAKLAEGVKVAQAALDATDSAIDALRLAQATDRGLSAVDHAAEMARLVGQRADDLKALDQATNGAMKIGGDVAKANVLGRAARSETMTDIVRTVYATYEPLQQLHVDKALKGVRAVFDPLGAFSLNVPLRKQAVDLMTDFGTKTMLGAYGFGNHAALVHGLADFTEGASTPLADMFSEDMGTYAANLLRRVVARRHRDVALANNLAGALQKNESVEGMLARAGTDVPTSYSEYVLREANAHRIMEWDDVAKQNLVDRLVDNYGIKSAEEWADFIATRNADELSMLHAATYGRATKRLLEATEQAATALAGTTEGIGSKVRRLILINRNTLTEQGAGGIIEGLTRKNVALEDKLAFIEEMKRQYPELAGFSIDPANPGRSIERFVNDLKRRAPALPSQVMDDELKQLPDDLRSLHTDKTYTLGFAPEDQYKWGLVRSNAAGGGWEPVYDVWTDHVAPGLAMGYRTMGQKIEQNILGQPILGPAKPLAKGLDYIEAGINTLNNRISGTLIAETARNKFVAKAAAKYNHVGISDAVAKDMITALEEAVGQQDIVVRASGLTTESMWNIAKQVIPHNVAEADFGRRELLALVLDAYDGDMRYVGLTQKLSMRVKKALSFGGNNASVLAEQVYPTLKYRLNMIFQAQEKAEPWVLNAFRGVTPARSIRSLNDADKATQTLVERMMQHSLVSNADHEMNEYAGGVLHGKKIEELAQSRNSALGKMTNRLGVDWAAIRDVKGMKQINMLRTFRKGLAKDLRAAYEEVDPGRWDDMYREYVRKAGKGTLGVDEDEFAVSLMADKMLGNEVFVSAIEDRVAKMGRVFDKVDYKAAIQPGEWMSPQTMGELRALNLDSMTGLLGFSTKAGRPIKTQGDLRAAIAAGDLKIEDVLTALARYGADPDYANRVKMALEFSYTGFWDQVASDFNISPERIAVLQDSIESAAALRGMTSVDYLSQIITPTIGEGGVDAVVGHLGQIEDILNGSGDVVGRRASLSQLQVPIAGGGNEDMLVGQLADVFVKHLDPSAKRALIEQFMPNLKERIGEAQDIDIEMVNRLWDENIHDEFVRYLTGEINPPTDLADAYESGLLRTVSDWDRVDPPEPVGLHRDDGSLVGITMHRVGQGVRDANPDVQRIVLKPFAEFSAQFPEVRVHIDIADDFDAYLQAGEVGDGVAGVTIKSAGGGHAVILNSKYYGGDPTRTMDEAWKNVEDINRTVAAGEPGKNPAIDRESLLGAPDSLGGAHETVVHELGHAFDEQVRRLYADAVKAARKAGKQPGKTKDVLRYKAYVDFIEKEFPNSLAARRLSEYANAVGQEHGAEAGAELFAAAFSGTLDPKALDAATAKYAEDFLRGEGPQALAVAPKVWHDPLRIKKIEDAEDFLRFAKSEAVGLTPAESEDFLSVLNDWREAILFDAPKDEIRDIMEIAQERAMRIVDDVQALDIRPMGIGIVDPKTLMKGPQTVEEAVNMLKAHVEKTGLWKKPPAQLDRSLQVNAKPLIKGMRGSSNPDVIRAGHMFNRWTRKVIGDHIRDGGTEEMRNVLAKIGGMPDHAAVPYNFGEHQIMNAVLENMRSKWDDAHRLQYYSRQRSMLERSVNHPMFGIYPASYMWGKMLPEMVRFLAKEPFGIKTGAAAYSTMDVMRNIALQREYDESFDKHIEDLGHAPAMFALGYMMPSWPWEISAAMPTWSREFAQEGLDMQSRVEAGGTVKTDAGDSGVNIPQVLGKATDVMNPVKALDRTIFTPLESINKKEEAAASPWYPSADTGPVAGSELEAPMTDALSELRDWLSGARQ